MSTCYHESWLGKLPEQLSTKCSMENIDFSSLIFLTISQPNSLGKLFSCAYFRLAVRIKDLNGL